MGRPLDPERAGRDGGGGAQGPARAPAPAGAPGAPRRRPRARQAHGAPRGGARGARPEVDARPGSGPGGGGLVRGGQGPAGRGGAGDGRDRGRGRLRRPRPGSRPGGAQPRPGGGRDGDRRRHGQGRLRPLPARRGHRFGQDRGLSGGGGADAEGRSGGADPDPAARDRPHPGPDRPHHRPLRRRPGGMALRGRPAAPAPGVGGCGRRPLQHRGRGPLGPVPALRQPAARRRRRGARRFVQAGRRAGLSRPRPGRGAGADRGGDGGAGLGDAVAGDALERASGPLRLAQAGRAARGGAAARGDLAGPAPVPARSPDLAVPAPARGHRRDPAARRADPAVPEPARLCPRRPVPDLRSPADGARHRQLAGRASLHRAADLPPDRFHHGAAETLSRLRRGRQPGLGRSGGRTGRGGGAPAVSRGAHGGVQLRRPRPTPGRPAP